MILAEFAKYIIENKNLIINSEKSAVYMLTDWIRDTLNTEPVQHWQRIIHTEIMIVKNSYNEFLILGKSDSGRILINALYNYALSYEHYILAKNIPDCIEFKLKN